MRCPTIETYNEYLTTQLIRVNVKEYFINVCAQFFPKIEQSLIEFYVDKFFNRYSLVVTHEDLLQYKLLTNEPFSEQKFKRCLNWFNSTSSQDHMMTKAYYVCKEGGVLIKYRYTLTPEMFYLCLGNLPNSKKYGEKVNKLQYVERYYKNYKIHYLCMWNNKMIELKKIRYKLFHLMLTLKSKLMSLINKTDTFDVEKVDIVINTIDKFTSLKIMDIEEESLDEVIEQNNQWKALNEQLITIINEMTTGK